MTIEEAVGSLKAHEERLRGKNESNGSQLLLTEEEWRVRENNEGKLLLTREEWLKRSNKADTQSGSRYQGNISNYRGEAGRTIRGDRSKVKCFNCHLYGHYAAECRKPRRGKDKDQKTEVNLTRIHDDDEPALLMVEHMKETKKELMLNEQTVRPRLSATAEKLGESNMWYIDNGASNHMTGYRSKFKSLDEGVMGQVRFGDGSTVEIQGRGSVGFKCKNGEELIFHDVYYIPSLCNSIISLGQLSENGKKVF
ncbi:uncharacterized protein LOC141704700 [Apium graveolens]|uniref:uncharacterized protein LOC141704700 n=1 Tax=Apium graveolens TaxID=4045 RepID=UPI003D7AA52D